MLIENTMSLDENAAVVSSEYPIIADINKLWINQDQVAGIKLKVWDRLIKKGKLESYNEEMRGYMKQGTFREISKMELPRSRIIVAVNNLGRPEVCKDN